MAENKWTYREGCRDSYPFWIETHVKSEYNYKLDTLKDALRDILIPWNSSIEQVQRAAPEQGIEAVYKFTFGCQDLAASESVMKGVLCKMNKMEERYAQMQLLHEPEEWFVPIEEPQALEGITPGGQRVVALGHKCSTDH